MTRYRIATKIIKLSMTNEINGNISNTIFQTIYIFYLYTV